MSVTFEEMFPARYSVDVRDVAPPGAVTFERAGSTSTSEVVIEVATDQGELWSGVAKAGPPSVRGAVSGVFSTPASDGLCVIARGDAYLVDVAEPDLAEVVDTAGPVVQVRPVVDRGLLLLASPWAITALDESGLRWQTDRLSIDGIRLDEAEGCRLAGVADPEDSEPRDFVVDLDTGRHEGGTPLA